MSNETKRDVFNDALARYHDEEVYHTSALASRMDDYPRLRARYDAALPDDLPVIPKEVGGLIKVQKARCLPLSNVLGAIYNLDILRQEPSSRVLVWVKNNEDTFARAWVLGAWKVKETGEIVKLEAEK